MSKETDFIILSRSTKGERVRANLVSANGHGQKAVIIEQKKQAIFAAVSRPIDREAFQKARANDQAKQRELQRAAKTLSKETALQVGQILAQK